MTFDEFRSTALPVDNLAKNSIITDDSWPSKSGILYLSGDLMIIGSDMDGYTLIIANCEWRKPKEELEVLESILYNWAKDEGYFD